MGMALFTRNYTGKIDGKDAWSYSLTNKDYEIKGYEERLEVIKKLLNINEDGFTDDKFLQEVWGLEEGCLKVNPNTTDMLWSESNVGNMLERLGSYLLNDPNLKGDNVILDDEVVKLYDSSTERDRIKQESNTIHKKGFVVEFDDYGKPIKVLKNDMNYKKAIEFKINKTDFKNYPELQDYENYKNYLLDLKKDKDKRKELSLKINRDMGQVYGSVMNNLKSVQDDMIIMKLSKERPIQFKMPLKDEGCPSWDELDMFDEEHVYYLLPMRKEPDLQDDLYCIIHDLDNLIKKCKFTDKQKLVLECYRTGMGITTIAKHCGIDVRDVDKIIKACVKIIISQYEKEYSDWYYLNICKGEYKQCSKCGEIKLVHEFNKNGNYYRSQCKECQNSK